MIVPPTGPSATPPPDPLMFSVKQQPDFDLSVQETATLYPFRDSRYDNTMISLEKALIEEYAKATGMTPEQAIHQVGDRDRLLDQIRPNITRCTCALDRKDPNDANSSIHFTLLDNDRMKVKMTWTIEVTIAGQSRRLVCEQDFVTEHFVPPHLDDIETLEFAKYRALLQVKIHQKLHKKALLGGKYTINKTMKGRLKEFDTKKELDQLIRNLRSPNRYDVKHYPNPFSFHTYSGARVFHLTLMKGEVASDSKVTFADGSQADFIYLTMMGIQGRKLKEYKPGDILPSGEKANTVVKKWMKTDKEDEQGAMGYESKLYQQAMRAAIKDPRYDALNELSMKRSEDIVKELRDKITAGIKISIPEFKRHQENKLKSQKKAFDTQRKQFLDALYSGAVTEMEKQGLKGKLTSLGLGVYTIFAGESSIIKSMFDSSVKNFLDAMREYENAKRDGQTEVIADARKKLKQAHDGLKNLQDGAKGLKELVDDIELKNSHIKQINLSDPTLLQYNHDNDVQKAKEDLELFKPLLEDTLGAQMLLAQRALSQP